MDLLRRQDGHTLRLLCPFLFLCWSLISLLWTANVYDGIDNAIQLVIISQAFVVGCLLKDLKPIFIGLALGLNVWVDLFNQIDVLAEIALFVCIWLLLYEIYWLALVCIPPIVMHGARAAVLTGTVMLACWFWYRSRIATVIFVCFVCIGAISYSFGKPDALTSLDHRLVMWSDTINGFTFFGHGLGSFMTEYPFYTHDIDTMIGSPNHAHNEYLNIAFELGLPGLLLFLVICWNAVRSDTPEKYVFVAFMLVSCFDFPFHMPVSACLVAMVCGHIVCYSTSNRRILVCMG